MEGKGGRVIEEGKRNGEGWRRGKEGMDEVKGRKEREGRWEGSGIRERDGGGGGGGEREMNNKEDRCTR